MSSLRIQPSSDLPVSIFMPSQRPLMRPPSPKRSYCYLHSSLAYFVHYKRRLTLLRVQDIRRCVCHFDLVSDVINRGTLPPLPFRRKKLQHVVAVYPSEAGSVCVTISSTKLGAPPKTRLYRTAPCISWFSFDELEPSQHGGVDRTSSKVSWSKK
jgi:hypothetical protein